MSSLAKRLPDPVKEVARRFASIVDGPLVARFERQTGQPVPPWAMRARVGGMGMGRKSIEHYLAGGARGAQNLRDIIAGAGRDIGAFGSVLDFGCGSGRLLRHLDLPGTLTGCDVDAAAVEWARGHLDARLDTTGYEPPLPYRDDEFDLILSVSIFSHFNQQVEAMWLPEIARILAPGGLAVLTIHGTRVWKFSTENPTASSILDPADLDAGRSLEEEGMIFAPYYTAHPDRIMPGIGEGFGVAYHSETYIREVWGQHFTVEQIVAGGMGGWQDAVVLSPRV